MKKDNFYRKAFLVASFAIVANSIAPAAYANDAEILLSNQATANETTLSQNPATADLCRRIVSPPEGLVIRANPSTAAATVGGVARGQTITLTTSPATTSKDTAGRTWVQISAPARGWISNGLPGSGGHIVVCSGDQPPPPPNRCRRVLNPPEGLAIRSQASKTANRVGGVGLYERMTLTTSPATTSRDSEGRTWVQIEAPAAGWISNGLGGGGNIGVCP